MMWALDLIWPFCGWRPGRRHVLVIGRILTVSYEVACERCRRKWMVHRHYPGMLPWNDEVEAFFRKRTT